MPQSPHRDVGLAEIDYRWNFVMNVTTQRFLSNLAPADCRRGLFRQARLQVDDKLPRVCISSLAFVASD